ncbi:MAG: DUF5780 domain-containing protein [Clostridia bacterium]|nr:DUF5780 domain-containing protein [Clostridia bacterium]
MNKIKELIKKYKILCIVITIVIVLVISTILVLYFKNPKNSFIYNLNNNNFTKANEIYEKSIKYDKKVQVETEIEVEKIIASITENFNNAKKGYNESIELLNSVEKTGMLKDKVIEAKKIVEDLNKSKTAYLKAIEYSKSGDYYNTLVEFNSVIEKDINYNIAKEKSSEILSKYREELFKTVDENVAKGDYDKSIELLTQLSKISPEDKEIQTKIEVYKDKKIVSLKDKQEVNVVSADFHTQWYSDTVSGIKVIIKNNTNKVIKNYTLGILAYDKDNYPLQISYSNTLFRGKGESVNIQPGQTGGEDTYFDIYYNEEKMKTAIACVESVEYYDGTEWTNPYYQLWLEKYNDKRYSN